MVAKESSCSVVPLPKLTEPLPRPLPAVLTAASNVPPLTAIGPVNVLAPVRRSTPLPLLVRPPARVPMIGLPIV